MAAEILHIAFDDTDSRNGRCTTHLAFKIVQHLKEIGAELVDYPLLVRLNPNIPWKTRGNGAVCLRARVRDTNTVIDYVKDAVENGSAIGCGANPGLVFLVGEIIPAEVQRFASAAMYDVLSRQMAEKAATKYGLTTYTYGNGQGLVGAIGAIGSPMIDTDYTFELIAYRKPEFCGTPRVVDEQQVVKFSEETYPYTFNNYDRDHQRVLVAPHGPDPVFFGIRGESAEIVSSALSTIRPKEEQEGSMVFRSNQGTNMHLHHELQISTIRAYTAGFLRCKVSSRPNVIEGGHVIFAVEQGGYQMPAAVYEPTALAKIAAKLQPGDTIEIGCGVRKGTTKHPKILNVEYLLVEKIQAGYEMKNPVCKNCGKRMKSEGRNKGFQCDKCKFKDAAAQKILIPVARDLRPGLYLPTPKAHRHLTKPMQRYGLEKKSFIIART